MKTAKLKTLTLLAVINGRHVRIVLCGLTATVIRHEPTGDWFTALGEFEQAEMHQLAAAFGAYHPIYGDFLADNGCPEKAVVFHVGQKITLRVAEIKSHSRISRIGNKGVFVQDKTGPERLVTWEQLVELNG